MIDSVVVLCSARHKIDQFGYVPHANLLAWYGKTKFKSTHSPIKRNVQTTQLECGPMPNLMVALPNIGGTLCSTPQSLADAHY